MGKEGGKKTRDLVTSRKKKRFPSSQTGKGMAVPHIWVGEKEKSTDRATFFSKKEGEEKMTSTKFGDIDCRGEKKKREKALFRDDADQEKPSFRV